jgi:hypothetical protein
MKSNVINLAFRGCTAALATLAMTAMVSTANAQTVTPFGHGAHSIEINTAWQSYNTGYALPSGTSQATNAYNFIFTTSTLNQDTATSSYGPLTLQHSGFTGAGSNGFIALDTDFPTAGSDYIQTTVSGLSAGTPVTINFAWALDEQSGYTGAFNTTFTVSLGTDNQSVTLPEYVSATAGATVYTNQTLTFTPTSDTEILKFAASSVGVGSTGNLPSFLLLAPGVTAQTTSTPTVPEPGSLALLSTGLLGLGGFVRSRFGKKS